MKKLCAMFLSVVIGIGMILTGIAADGVDYTDELTYGVYGGDGNWWDHSDAEVIAEEDYIRIKNVDNNAEYSAVDVANDALGGEYADYTTEDYASLANSGVSVQNLVRDALSANKAANKRTLGKTNHGLLSDKIAVSSQSTRIRFTAKFLEPGHLSRYQTIRDTVRTLIRTTEVLL